MLQVKYKNDGTCQRNGTLIFRVYAADSNLFNIYFNLSAQEFFRGSSKDRGIFIPFIAADSYAEFVIPFRGARSFNSPQASFKVEVQCSVKYNGEDVPLRWDGDFTRDVVSAQSSVTNNTYHVENNTTLNAADNAIAYMGKSSNDYSGLQDDKDDSAKVEFVEITGMYRRAAELCTKPVLVKIDTGRDLERGALNELTICFDPCIPGGKNWQFTMKKATGTLFIGGKKLTFSKDSFFEQPCLTGEFQFSRNYCRIPIDLSEKVSNIYLSRLICSGEMGDDDFCFSTPPKYECELLAPPIQEFSDIEDLGLLPMVPADEKEHLSNTVEETPSPVEMINSSYVPTPVAAPVQGTTVPGCTVPPAMQPGHPSTIAPAVNTDGLHPDVIRRMQMDNYKEGKVSVAQESEFQKACRLFGSFGNGLNPEYAYPVFLREYESGTENSIAVEKLAECYLLGIGTPQDLSKGLELMKHAADAGNAEAMCHYADCCLSGTGMIKNIEAGKKYLLSSANAGDTNAMCKLAGLYLAGKLVPRNYAEAKRLYTQANTLDARYALACMKYFGFAEEQNIPAAVGCFAELSNHGHVPSLIMYANCLANGIGVEQNIAQADAICSEIPGKSGVLSGIAYKNAAMMNFRQENYSKAVDLLQKAVKNHNAEAAFILSQKCYNAGLGVPKNGIVAVELLKWASKQNHRKSMLQLAECWLRGLGVYQDYGQAVEILKKFDKSNDPHYLFLMGMCHYHGLGIDEDEAAGLRLLKRSADAGYPPAVEYLEEIEL